MLNEAKDKKTPIPPFMHIINYVEFLYNNKILAQVDLSDTLYRL